MANVPTEDKQFVRDPSSQALLNTDKNGLLQYKRARSQASVQKDFENRLSNIEGTVEEIYLMLKQLCNQGR